MSNSRLTARREAIRALARAEKTDVSPDWSKIAPDALGLARELFSGVMRWRAALDWTLAPLLSKKLEKLDAPARAALRCALYERIELQTPAHAIANDYAGLMRDFKISSASGLINAICRRLPTQFRAAPAENPARLATEFSHPQWLVARYLKRFGEAETTELLRANQTRAPLVLRVNTLKITREELILRWKSDGLEPKKSEFAPDALILENAPAPPQISGWNEGFFAVQDEAAQLVAAFALDFSSDFGKNDDFFAVDAAAAPGGKTTHLAQLLANRGRILACDSAPPRLELVEQNARRLGLQNIETRAGDFRVLARDLGSQADLVLLDAPCVGTGTLRRRPDAKWRKSAAQLSELVGLQSELLDSAAKVVKSGGFLVYATCSLEIEENQAQIAAFLAQHDDWKIARPTGFGATVGDENFLYTAPHRNGCDGMFAARLEKI